MHDFDPASQSKPADRDPTAPGVRPTVRKVRDPLLPSTPLLQRRALRSVRDSIDDLTRTLCRLEALAHRPAGSTHAEQQLRHAVALAHSANDRLRRVREILSNYVPGSESSIYKE